jgi:type II secretory pathway pseudopilin PulG
MVELIVAVAIVGAITSGLAMVIFQITDVSSRSSTRQTLVRDVENAVHWINRDAQMSQTVTPTGLSGFPLTLTWTEWDNTSNSVTYIVQDNELRRLHTINGGQPVTIVVSRYLDETSNMTNVQYSGGSFTFRVTSFIGGYRPSSESRSIKVLPRSIHN